MWLWGNNAPPATGTRHSEEGNSRGRPPSLPCNSGTLRLRTALPVKYRSLLLVLRGRLQPDEEDPDR